MSTHGEETDYDTKTRLAVIIATYNEVENLPTLVQQIFERLPRAEILVIDDNSPDGTGKWCEEFSRSDTRLSLLHRPEKSGLGTAAVAGFRWALERDFELIATMDGDLSHDPSDLKSMVQLASVGPISGYDVMIGSRYIEGGKIENWPFWRRWTSRLANRLARTLLGLKTRDNTSAYRVYRREALAGIDLDEIKSPGYAYLEEILYRLQQSGFRANEYPITFRNRQHGRTKSNWREGLQFVRLLMRLAIGR